jgi:TolB-like protein/tetratricopeptide (TPR) repeat protein
LISWRELKQRRITQIVLSYLFVGWVTLGVVDTLVGRTLFPEIVYRVGLLVYLGGIPAALIVGWFHGEKGSQSVTPAEVSLLLLVLLVTGLVVRRDLQASRVALPGDLDSAYDPRRVAVLYFDDGGGAGADFAFAADGLTEALIDELGRVRELDVVSRNGVDPYRGTELAADSVGRALGAGSVIKGSVERDGERVRVNVRLVDAESGVDIDRTSFTLPAADLLAARDSLVTSTASFLRARLGEEVRIRESRSQTRSVDAWTHVQRAERLRKDATAARQHDPARAVALLAQADSLLSTSQSLDPDWLEPTAMRAEVALQRGILSRSADERFEFADAGIELADQALARDANFARAWEVRGTLRHYQWYLNVSPTPQERGALLDAAQSDLERAVELDPTLAAALNRLSTIYYYERRDVIRGALLARQALDADSYLRDAAQTLDRLFWAHYDLGQFSEAGRTCKEAEARFAEDARFKQCALWMMITPTGTPDPDAAWRLLAQADSLTAPDERAFEQRVGRIIVGGVLARANLSDSARSVLESARAEADEDPDQQLPGYEAIVRTILGDHDDAVERLRRYVSANPDHRFEVEGDLHWWWRPLRDHPGFAAVVARGS